LEHYNVFEKGEAIRHQPRFSPNGTNVNFVEPCGDNEIYVRTFERGVENETLSCGTGVTAASLAASYRGFTSPVKIKTKGGSLKVAFKRTNKESFKEIFLIGPAGMVFEGKVEI
jgi:diaminopimelate epimerase